MEKFRKFWFADVGKSVLRKKKKKHAQNIRSTVHRTGDLVNWMSQSRQCRQRGVLYKNYAAFIPHVDFSHTFNENEVGITEFRYRNRDLMDLLKVGR